MLAPLALAALALPLASAASHASASASGSVSAHPSASTVTQRAVAASKVANAAAGSTPSPLTDYTYAYSEIPYQVNPYQYLRGPQSGYNICNSTTAGDQSQCQTLIMNDIDDFCLWGSPTAEGLIGDIEAAVVAFCTNNNHGGRVMPAGTITGVQWITTSAYIQITGFLNQEGINLQANDTGGELDPHGADLLGNPLGGLVYSTNLPGGNNSTYIQAINWNNFVGSGQFCLKLCFNSITSPDYCQNKFDLLGCSYNMPSANVDGEFVKCDGDLQDEVGTYTGTDGKTTVWSQPESLDASTVLPWTPRVPASSNCVTYSSEQLFGVNTATSASAAATTSAGAASTSGQTNAAAVSTASAGGSVVASSQATSAAASAATSTSNTSGALSSTSFGGSAAFVLGSVAAAILGGVALVA